MWIRVNDVELSDTISCNGIIEFRCVSPGCPGDYWTEPEGPEFEITDAYIEEAWAGNYTEDGWKEVWGKGRDEMGKWASILDKRLNDLADDLPDLYELQYDEYCYSGDY